MTRRAERSLSLLPGIILVVVSPYKIAQKACVRYKIRNYENFITQKKVLLAVLKAKYAIYRTVRALWIEVFGFTSPKGDVFLFCFLFFADLIEMVVSGAFLQLSIFLL